ncbi:SusC/RagA family TonB-linked outer membrane protein [Flammeovirga kamogawensis]|uniref:SusC/RagA family TonB-linked outer membrane protein n=1 Tax=Flammeovirga kamogawensis TaxID=373891 RepID=A0ABX8H3K4_9BACT|nr:SusC/RagA family TonB-linked outer membrane protein [Flammeovirga kamogawensis]MBB6460448.1 TonB-linked SusC/RagA family outer membrane protein [Flammeovirga kamogawensis]QWG10253.1 SusC/RagA family TonB-linked outer membrane protein [Flammeovirga kamogawensis]TRX64702.1 SusC/RagA family TonB-linked outer membrane protein [Flammeovirga kamogawensis]
MKRIITTLLLLLSIYSLTQAQNEIHIVNGVVFDEATDIPLPGVNVLIKGTAKGAVTDIEGNFSLQASVEDILVFSFIGMQPKEVKVGYQTSVRVTLKEDTKHLKEIVVTALGIDRDKESLSYATQQVDTEELLQGKQSDFVTNLSGKVAGVQVTASDSPTGSSRVVIRGVSSLAKDNQPLYVIDGVPIESGSGDSGVSVGGSDNNIDYGGGASFVNPEDIADIQVLKGANAAALYGSRATNGVIMITTKKSSKKNKGWGVSYGFNYQIREVAQYPDYQNKYGAGNAFRLAASERYRDPETGLPLLNQYNRSWGSPMLGQDVIGYNGQPTTYDVNENNIKDFFQRGSTMTNSISLQKSGKNSSVYISYTHLNADDIVDTQNLQVRNTFNIRATSKITDFLDVDTKMTYVGEKTDNRMQKNGSVHNPYYVFTFMHRNANLEDLKPWKDANGNEFGQRNTFSNPYWAIYENSNNDQMDRILPTITLNAKIVDGLSFKTRIGGDVQFRKGELFNNKGSVNDPDGYYSTFNRDIAVWNYEAFLNYTKRKGKFDIQVNVGASRFDRVMNFSRTEFNSLVAPDFGSSANAASYPEVYQTEEKKRINSVFATTSIGYNDILYVDISARNDWSSTLPEGNNSYFYPSVGTSFIFTNALQMSSSILSFGKLRGSLAQVGNDTDFNQINNTYNYGGNYNGYAWVTNQTLKRNTDLKPESTTSWELGTELKFFGNRVSLDATYYDNVTSNQIIRINMPKGSGYDYKMINAGEVQNSGIELVLGTKIIDSKAFSWDMNVNWSKNTSIVNSLYKDEQSGVDITQIRYRGVSNISVNAEVGQPFGVIRGSKWLTDDEGRKLVTSNGVPIQDQEQILGNAQPDWLGAISNSFKYKNFDLSVLIDAKIGGQIFSETYSRAETWGNTKSSLEGRDDYWYSNVILGENNSERAGIGEDGRAYGDLDRSKGIMLDAWVAERNPETGEWEAVKKNDAYMSPQLFYQLGTSNANEYNTYDASYVKLREVSIGYNIPQKLLRKFKIKRMRIAAVGRNLWIIYQNTPRGIDPEAASYSGNGQGIEIGSLPPTSTLGVDFRINF